MPAHSVFFVAGLINLVGDLYLIRVAGMGVAGAAAATTGAQYIGAVYFIW